MNRSPPDALSHLEAQDVAAALLILRRVADGKPRGTRTRAYLDAATVSLARLMAHEMDAKRDW